MPTKKTTKRAASTRTHTVKAKLSVHELTKAGTGLFLEISARREKIGELEIGRGALYWKGGKRQIRKRLPWPKFAELMDRLAYGDE